MSLYRIEKDSLGEMQILDSVYYGIQTQRAIDNFGVNGLPISGLTIGHYRYFIWSMAAIKKAAALANKEINYLEQSIADAIVKAADEILSGGLSDQFPLDVLQGGGYTSANMNVNEVIGNRANEIITGKKGSDKVHPNTHVNMGQSTNDVIPAVLKLSCYKYISDLVESVNSLETALKNKVEEFKDIVKIGRTCLQDAVPLTLGQEFSGYYDLIKRRKKKLLDMRNELLTLPLGGTAIGTELGAGAGFIEAAYLHLSKIIGYEVVPDNNFFDGLQNADIYIDLSANLKALAAGISKIATDLRILSSGPNGGIQEIILPALQPGSSIMPGKINPVMPELINQICYQVCGNDLVISMAVEGGELDLNVWEPVIFKCIAESFMLLTNGINLFTEKCITGLQANIDICRDYSERSTALSTVVATLFGYQIGSDIAKKAAKEKKTVKQVAVEEKIFTQAEADELLDPMVMTCAATFKEKIDKYRAALP